MPTVTRSRRQHVKDSDSAAGETSTNNAVLGSLIISDDDVSDIEGQTGIKQTNKRSVKSKGPRAKRPRLQPPIIFDKDFRKSESFNRPEFLSFLRSNQHLRTIKEGLPKIFELLDKVRIENPALNEVFLALAQNDKKINPQFFDIALLVRPNDSLIFPPSWKDRTDSGATYVWSFDIPTEDLGKYCAEIEKDISEHPHQDTNTYDYRSAIVKQFHNYLENELPLNEKIKVFRWLYVGQTTRSPPFARWRNYYRKKTRSQRTLNFSMCTLTERNVPHRLVVVSSDGSMSMEAVVAALLNIHVDFSGAESNAINRAVCGLSRNQFLPKNQDEQAVALSKFNSHLEMIICVHCTKEISVNSHTHTSLYMHRCTDPDVKRNNEGKDFVYNRLFTQMDSCPSKDTCKACVVILPKPDDTSKDLPLEEILLKPPNWRRALQDLILDKFDVQKEKIMCMHCRAEIKPSKTQKRNIVQLQHKCAKYRKRSEKTNDVLPVLSNLFTVHTWCPDEVNCKACIQLVDRNDDEENNISLIPLERRHRDVMRNFDFAIRKIICVHCGKEQSRKKNTRTILNTHVCRSEKKAHGRLFQKTKWCPDAECQQCFRIEDR